MFDKTFFKLAIGFIAIIFFGVGSLFLAGQFSPNIAETEAAAAK